MARSDWTKDRVAVVSGGGAGHEPADVGMVAEGMLTAAVCGEIFTSPPADAVVQALVAITGHAGCLVVVRNGVGNNLNFVAGIKEVIKTCGLQIRIVRVADDLATARPTADGRADFSKARGLAGLHMVVKVAGAAAQAGLPLDAVYAEALAMAQVVRTQGVGFSSCSIPGQVNRRPIPADEMEIGMGIHGEPGQTRVKATSTAGDIIDTMISQLKRCVPDEVPLVVLLNNLGAVPQLEMSILAAQVMRSELAERVRLFIGPAHLLTSLDTNGISLSIAPLDDLRTERLLAPVASRYWCPAVVPRRPQLPAARRHRGLGYPPTQNETISQLISRACEVLVAAERDLNMLDAVVENGDCGRNLAHAARLVSAAQRELPLDDPAPLCCCLSQLLRGAEGALSALFSVFFGKAAKSLGSCSSWCPGVVEAFVEAQHAVEALGEVSEGMRTFMDALAPALRAAPRGWAAMAFAAQRGARATARMAAAVGRAAHASVEQRLGVPDTGAMALALILAAMAAPESGRLQPMEDDASVAELFQLGEVIGEGSFGVVRAATDSRTGAQVAVKVSRRGKESGPRSFESLDFLEKQHMSNWLFNSKPNIVRIHEVMVSPTSVYLIMEHLTGPELSDWLASRNAITERCVAKVVRQALSAVREIHAFGMVHRDLKADNFRFASASAEELKLVDVVGTMCFQPSELDTKKSLCGTASYMSPEALLGECTPAVDMWALGVLVYLMLSGSFPFSGPTLPELHEAHKRPLDLEAEPWPAVSAEGRDFVGRLLAPEAARRPSAQELLGCGWIVGADAMSEGLPLRPSLDELPACMGLTRLMSPRSEAQAVPKTLVLVRHGEALHNIREREAKKQAQLEASGKGFAEGSAEVRSEVERAMKEVLRDEAFRDAPLSPNGKAMALDAQAEMNRLMAKGISMPTRVLVSPLERALQTAAIVFPNHPSTHVVEDLRERRTGLPCDERKMAAEVAARATFCHMSFDHLLHQDLLRVPGNPSLEDKPKLRERTAEVVELLRSRPDHCLAIVTHKGFLRELERGPLERPEATEFGNCEVRVYDVTFTPDGGLISRVRYSRDVTGAPSP